MKKIILTICAALIAVSASIAFAGDLKLEFNRNRYYAPPVQQSPYQYQYQHRYRQPRSDYYYNWHHYSGGPSVAPYTYQYGRAPYGGYQHFGVMPPIDRDRSPYIYYGWQFKF